MIGPGPGTLLPSTSALYEKQVICQDASPPSVCARAPPIHETRVLAGYQAVSPFAGLTALQKVCAAPLRSDLFLCS